MASLQKRGRGKSTNHLTLKYVGEMWESINYPHDGDDRDWPWSAAFISFVVRRSGICYRDFAFAASHSIYVNRAIRKKLANNEHPFWGYRLHEKTVRVGDIVCMGRTNHNITYDLAASDDTYASHCDIVVAIRDDKAFTIGGNVSHSVRLKTFNIDDNGYLKDERRLYALLSNNCDGSESVSTDPGGDASDTEISPTAEDEIDSSVLDHSTGDDQPPSGGADPQEFSSSLATRDDISLIDTSYSPFPNWEVYKKNVGGRELWYADFGDFEKFYLGYNFKFSQQYRGLARTGNLGGFSHRIQS